MTEREARSQNETRNSERVYEASLGFSRKWLLEEANATAEVYDEPLPPEAITYLNTATDSELQDIADEIMDYLFALGDQSYADMAFDIIKARVAEARV